MYPDFENFLPEIQERLSSTWEAPIPIEHSLTMPFPTESLPSGIRAMVEYLSESTQTPVEMAGVLSLGVLATAFQKRYEVEITPDWREPLCLYCVAIAPPGERKSAVMSAMTRPIYDYESAQKQAHAADIARNRMERKLLEDELEKARKAATEKMDHSIPLELAEQLEEFEEMHETRFLADDSTPEKLVALMEEQGGCITVCSAEGGVFDAMLGRYERSLNLDVYLKAHAGDPIVVDRLGRSANRVDRPRMSMMLTIQPEVLSGVMRNSAFRGRGLCARFLFALCRSKVGYRKTETEPVPEDVRNNYNDFVKRILSGEDSGVIHLSADADQQRREYQEKIEHRLRSEWADILDWGCKLVGATVRIAALISCARGETVIISGEDMSAAISIGEYLGESAVAAYQTMGNDSDTETAKYILRRITGKERVTQAELCHLCQRRNKKSADLDPAIELLKNHNYLREHSEAVGYNGRSKTVYEINPNYVELM